MIAVQSQTETRRGGPVPGLDQPCSRNPTAALPLVGSDPYVTCTPSGERGATGLGVPLPWKNGVAEMISSVKRTPHGPVCALHARFECCGHGNVEKRYASIRDKCAK